MRKKFEAHMQPHVQWCDNLVLRIWEIAVMTPSMERSAAEATRMNSYNDIKRLREAFLAKHETPDEDELKVVDDALAWIRDRCGIEENETTVARNAKVREQTRERVRRWRRYRRW